MNSLLATSSLSWVASRRADCSLSLSSWASSRARASWRPSLLASSRSAAPSARSASACASASCSRRWPLSSSTCMWNRSLLLRRTCCDSCATWTVHLPTSRVQQCPPCVTGRGSASSRSSRRTSRCRRRAAPPRLPWRRAPPRSAAPPGAAGRTPAPPRRPPYAAQPAPLQRNPTEKSRQVLGCSPSDSYGASQGQGSTVRGISPGASAATAAVAAILRGSSAGGRVRTPRGRWRLACLQHARTTPCRHVGRAIWVSLTATNHELTRAADVLPSNSGVPLGNARSVRLYFTGSFL